MRCDLETTHIVDFLLDCAWRARMSDEFSKEELVPLLLAADILIKMRCMARVTESTNGSEQDVVKA